MNNIAALYRFELRKIMKRRITAVVMIVVALLMIAMNIGEYVAGSRIVNCEETALAGKTVDDVMLCEMRGAIDPKYVTTEDGTRMAIGIGVLDRSYQPLMDYLTTIGGNIDKAYNMTEAELEKRFEGVVTEQLSQQYLTEDELAYWQARRAEDPMPLTYGKIQNGWGDSVCIIYVASILTMIAIAATLSGVFSDEIHLRTDALIYASRNGKRRLVTAKLLAGMTVGLLETLVILLACVGTEFAISGFEGAGTDVRFFVGPTAMGMTIGKAFGIYCGVMLVIGLLLSVFAMFLSQLCKNSIAVIAVMMGLWLVSMLTPPYSQRFLSQLCSYLPVTFLGSWTFSDYRTVGLFGHTFTILEFAPLVYIALSIVFGRITRMSYRRYQVTGR